MISERDATLAQVATGTLSKEESKELLDLCRAGRLFAVERWIASGRSIRVFTSRKKTPLDLAVEMGFHSLLEVLARAEPDQGLRNRALNTAVKKKRLDLIQLLLELGADIRSVPLADVFLTWEPSIIQYFLENGADAITDAPFAVGFGEHVRTLLRPFVNYRDAHPELLDQLQPQVDQALRFAAKEGDLKWVSMMLWAGANPRTPGPNLFEGHKDDPEAYTTAVEEACFVDNVEILKKFKVHPDTDNIVDLLGSAALLGKDGAFNYLLGLGVNLNDKSNGGSSALDNCLNRFGLEGFDLFHRHQAISRYAMSGVFGMVQKLVEAGALWRPEAYHVNSFRRSLFRCEPQVTVEVVKVLVESHAATHEVLERLLTTPKMRQHLTGLGINLPQANHQKARSQARRPSQSAKQAS